RRVHARRTHRDHPGQLPRPRPGCAGAHSRERHSCRAPGSAACRLRGGSPRRPRRHRLERAAERARGEHDAGAGEGGPRHPAACRLGGRRALPVAALRHRSRLRQAGAPPSGLTAQPRGDGQPLPYPACENQRMRTILNIIWVILAGFWLWVGYVFAGILLCIPIATIPWAIASFRIARYSFWPFGREVIDKPTSGLGSLLGNVVWVILAGWWLAIGHIVSGIALCIT